MSRAGRKIHRRKRALGAERQIEKIRRDVFRMSQGDFARATGLSNDKVCKLESGSRRLTYADMFAIRTAARAGRIAWDDMWFFEPVTESVLRVAA